ncbi:MAG: class I SAM-dependent methyltransferase [Holophagales bacterium]|nr:class I SAM-dependent methyltransferase [Holophagales bacterium]
MSAAAGIPLPPGEAYRLWAASYDGENVLSAFDEQAVEALTAPLEGLSLLDAACGTARRLRFPEGTGPRIAVGVDLVLEMLRCARGEPSRSRRLAAGDLRALPLAAGAFDVVWCRLAAGHLRLLAPLYTELARVTRPGGAVILTDFHAEAARRGHVRSFRDASGVQHLVEHTVHEIDAHVEAAVASGLAVERRLEPAVGPEVRRLYEKSGRLDRYERDRGLPLLAAFRYRMREGP